MTFGGRPAGEIREAEVRRRHKERLTAGPSSSRPFGPVTEAGESFLMITSQPGDMSADLGFRVGAGELNRTIMTSLEGVPRHARIPCDLRIVLAVRCTGLPSVTPG
jgi:hypothetical protein